MRACLREPISEIADAARYLDAAVSAHLAGEVMLAERLIVLADISVIRDWTESIWGKNSPYVQYRALDGLPGIPLDERVKARMPNALERHQLHDRDGYHCRFCGIPVIRREIRIRIMQHYPNALRWGKHNSEQHAAFQAMWAQYDHVVPHARGGTNSLDNVVVSCAPCNFGRMSYTLAEVGLSNPFEREPVRSLWDGLERFASTPANNSFKPAELA
ncbi:MAG: HNH endonuclease signature motif containing protein [Candidatus Competibacteraceae bacterium]